mmetsp:Transcript_36249/g.91519  ORF Transcript_36249/g.91519 Transcript_36249/m.91519 type:complete len:390 (+) Transcript_36249:526-1695(+)
MARRCRQTKSATVSTPPCRVMSALEPSSSTRVAQLCTKWRENSPRRRCTRRASPAPPSADRCAVPPSSPATASATGAIPAHSPAVVSANAALCRSSATSAQRTPWMASSVVSGRLPSSCSTATFSREGTPSMAHMRSGTDGWTRRTLLGSMRARRRAACTPRLQWIHELHTDSRPAQSGRDSSPRRAACRIVRSSWLAGGVAATMQSSRRTTARCSFTLSARLASEAPASTSSATRSPVVGSPLAPSCCSTLMCGMKAEGTSKAKGDSAVRSRLYSCGGRAMCVALATGTNAACESRSSCAAAKPCPSRWPRMSANTASTSSASCGQLARHASPPSAPMASKCAATRSKGGGERRPSRPHVLAGGSAAASTSGTVVHTRRQSFCSAARL